MQAAQQTCRSIYLDNICGLENSAVPTVAAPANLPGCNLHLRWCLYKCGWNRFLFQTGDGVYPIPRFAIAGNNAIKYSNLNYQGIQFRKQPGCFFISIPACWLLFRPMQLRWTYIICPPGSAGGHAPWGKSVCRYRFNNIRLEQRGYPAFSFPTDRGIEQYLPVQVWRRYGSWNDLPGQHCFPPVITTIICFQQKKRSWHTHIKQPTENSSYRHLPRYFFFEYRLQKDAVQTLPNRELDPVWTIMVSPVLPVMHPMLQMGFRYWQWRMGQQLQYYTNNASNIKQDGQGNLVITKAESFSGFGFTSARIKTKNSASSIWACSRLKRDKTHMAWNMAMPSGLLGDNNVDTDGWPQCGEIDINGTKGQESISSITEACMAPAIQHRGHHKSIRTLQTEDSIQTFTSMVEWELIYRLLCGWFFCTSG